MGNPQAPALSVIIATKHGRHIRRCLQSLLRISDIQRHEVLVIADEAIESLRIAQLRKEFSDFYFYPSHLGGVSNARNLGLRLSKGSYFLFLDDDCLVGDARFIERIFELAADENFVHGGSYAPCGRPNYWNRVYQAVNLLWLRSGKSSRGQVHLLGGFIFGSAAVKSSIIFPPELTWGGEEKEMLLSLEKNTSISGKWHPDFKIQHIDESNLDVFVRRAFRQGVAAGKLNFNSPICWNLADISVSLFPGLVLFFILSRVGILAGKVELLWSKSIALWNRLPLQNSKREK